MSVFMAQESLLQSRNKRRMLWGALDRALTGVVVRRHVARKCVAEYKQQTGRAPRHVADPEIISDEDRVKELNEKFGSDAKKGSVDFLQGRGGLPMVKLTHECGSSAEIYLHGAVITSFKQPWGSEVLYVRPDAKFDRSKPISGGIPFCFPQFGPGEMQQHGFARNVDWKVLRTSADPNPDEREPEVAFWLTDNEYTRSMWNHKFEAIYVVTLQGSTLKTTFEVLNTNVDEDFDFTAALHTYFGVDSLPKSSVGGLKDLNYLDKSTDPENPTKMTEVGEKVMFDGKLLDRVYLDAPDYMELDVGTGAAVTVQTDNWKDCVVWNPGQTMPACFNEFVCVEQAVATTPVSLAPQHFWVGTAIYGTKDLN